MSWTFQSGHGNVVIQSCGSWITVVSFPASSMCGKMFLCLPKIHTGDMPDVVLFGKGRKKTNEQRKL